MPIPPRPDRKARPRYINTDHWAHYTYDSQNANHAIAIVGYDDSYPKKNFLQGHQPPADGAWIVKNSRGAHSEQFPNKRSWGIDGSGYFYLSCYDSPLAKPETFEFVELDEQDTQESTIGQYDYMPSSDTPNITSVTPVQMASVFMAQDNIAIHSLSTQTATANATVTYELYSLNPNYSAPADGTLIAAKTECYPFAGYYRLALDSFYAFKKGLPLSIIVTTKRADGTYEINYDKEAFKFGPQVSNTLFSL